MALTLPLGDQSHDSWPLQVPPNICSKQHQEPYNFRPRTHTAPTLQVHMLLYKFLLTFILLFLRQRYNKCNTRVFITRTVTTRNYRSNNWSVYIMVNIDWGSIVHMRYSAVAGFNFSVPPPRLAPQFLFNIRVAPLGPKLPVFYPSRYIISPWWKYKSKQR